MYSLIDEIFTEEDKKFITNVTLDILTDNSIKQNEIKNYLIKKGIGFYGNREGTNRIFIQHKEYDDLAIMIALDEKGIVDNDSDYNLFQDPELRPYITAVYENSGIICLCKKVRAFLTREEFDIYWNQILEILNELDTLDYLLDDVGPTQFMNWGYDEDLESPVILDFSYLRKKTNMDFTCGKVILDEYGDPIGVCDGIVDYDNLMVQMECPKCGAKKSFADIKNTASKESVIAETVYGNMEFDDDDYEDL